MDLTDEQWTVLEPFIREVAQQLRLTAWGKPQQLAAGYSLLFGHGGYAVAEAGARCSLR